MIYEYSWNSGHSSTTPIILKMYARCGNVMKRARDKRLQNETHFKPLNVKMFLLVLNYLTWFYIMQFVNDKFYM